MSFIIPDDEGPPGPVSPGPSGISQATPVAVPAPSTAAYLVLAADQTLAAERTLTAGTNVTLVDGGAGSTLTINAAGNGGASVTDVTGRTSDIATTAVATAPAVGNYVVEVYLLCTTADAAAGTLTVTISWTDAVGATSSTPITVFSLAATGRTTGRQLVRVASGNVSHAVAITGIYGTAVYAIHTRVVPIG